MSLNQIYLCTHLLDEFYGEIVRDVGRYIIQNGLCTLRSIVKGTGIDQDKVRKALCCLIQHGFCLYGRDKRGLVEYSMDVRMVLLLPRYPHFIYAAKLLYGDPGELLLEELLHHGQQETNSLLKKVMQRVADAYQVSGTKCPTMSEVREKMGALAQTHFIQRCTAPVAMEEITEVDETAIAAREAELYSMPEPGATRKRKAADAGAQSARKRRRISDSDSDKDSSEEDTGIRWRANLPRFLHYMRDQAIINAIARKIDKGAGEIVRAILRISEVKTHPDAVVTMPISCNEIYTALPTELGVSRLRLEQYLTVLVEDSTEFLLKSGESGGGMYSVHLLRAMTNLCKAHIESVVQEREWDQEGTKPFPADTMTTSTGGVTSSTVKPVERDRTLGRSLWTGGVQRFGSKCFRIFRLLLLKKQLEQKQIEDLAMIPAKEAKEMLYRMFGENFITLTEVPKTPDHAPSRTFYLFSVNLTQISRMLLEKCCKSMGNLISRRKHENKENKRLLEKQQRVDAIGLQLEQAGADAAQRQELEEMITPPERATLNRVKHCNSKLEQSEVQLDQSMFILEMYLRYSHLPT